MVAITIYLKTKSLVTYNNQTFLDSKDRITLEEFVTHWVQRSDEGLIAWRLDVVVNIEMHHNQDHVPQSSHANEQV